MGAEPLAAVPAAAPAPVSHRSDTTPAHGRFAMPHALVITTCIVTAAVLAPREMTVAEVLVLIAGAGGTGAAVVVAVTTGIRRVGRIGRFVRAYLTAGN
ncbi:hypothetical protein N4P33_02870 [Streptomyces sp. 15-116A]|uniref:hypothetical protein n=1 Tax=Streptomyces sp. 15-116A TaxID=2259035 RepID=UPI0021B2EFE2|nr:hypothetical protein [Streptomyces sp. 15-116A]MCT7351117.1 hypothetical protein [Streptomyces sp. 15-116A]